MSEEVKNKVPQIDPSQAKKILFFVGFALMLSLSVYTVDANENAVILRL